MRRRFADPISCWSTAHIRWSGLRARWPARATSGYVVWARRATTRPISSASPKGRRRSCCWGASTRDFRKAMTCWSRSGRASFRRWRMRGWFSLAEAQRFPPLRDLVAQSPVAASIDVVGFAPARSHRRDLATCDGHGDAERRGRFRVGVHRGDAARRSCHRIPRRCGTGNQSRWRHGFQYRSRKTGSIVRYDRRTLAESRRLRAVGSGRTCPLARRISILRVRSSAADNDEPVPGKLAEQAIAPQMRPERPKPGVVRVVCLHGSNCDARPTKQLARRAGSGQKLHEIAPARQARLQFRDPDRLCRRALQGPHTLHPRAEPATDFDYIAEKAAALGNDPARIEKCVSDEVKTETYRGVLRGPLRTLWAAAGNDLDRGMLRDALRDGAKAPDSFPFDQALDKFGGNAGAFKAGLKDGLGWSSDFLQEVMGPIARRRRLVSAVPANPGAQNSTFPSFVKNPSEPSPHHWYGERPLWADLCRLRLSPNVSNPLRPGLPRCPSPPGDDQARPQ